MALRSMKKGDPVKATLTPSSNLHPQIEEKINYILSPTYRRRLLGMGQPLETVNKLIKDRVNVLKNTQLRPYQTSGGDWTGGGYASVDPKTNRPFLAYDKTKSNADTIFAHELGHLTSGVDTSTLPENSYYPIRGTYGNLNENASREKLYEILGSGGSMYMSPTEQLVFDLQNKNLNDKNWALPGSLGYKMTGGKSLNEYFYGNKYSSNFPAGEKTIINSIPLENPSTSISSGNVNPTASNLFKLKGMKKNPNFTLGFLNNEDFNEKYLENIHDFSAQGIPRKAMAKSLGDIMQGAYDPHVYGATENKADLDAVRFLLKKHGYTENYGDNISPELWQKALKDAKINNDEHVKRMRKNFNDKSIINLNNRVAYENRPQPQSNKSTDYNV